MCSPSLPFLLIGEAISWPNSTNYYIPGLRFEIRARRTVASPLLTFNRLGKEDWETWHCLKKSVSPRSEQRIKKGGGGAGEGSGIIDGKEWGETWWISALPTAAWCEQPFAGWMDDGNLTMRQVRSSCPLGPAGKGESRVVAVPTASCFLALSKVNFWGEEKKKNSKQLGGDAVQVVVHFRFVRAWKWFAKDINPFQCAVA